MSQAPDSGPGANDPQEPNSQDSPSRHRSVADGELLSTWTLADFFSSLNTVMRLPARARRKLARAAAEKKAAAAEAAASAAKGLQPGLLRSIRMPKGLVAASVLLFVGVFVVRPLVVSASGSGDGRDLSPAYGVWQASTGKYAGRMFEVGEHSIAFRTSSASPDYTWHKIDKVIVRGAADSTLYKVVYVEAGKTAEFSFWFVKQAKPVIRFLHQPETVWEKTPYEPIARPKV